jgi:hypothetical protein
MRAPSFSRGSRPLAASWAPRVLSHAALVVAIAACDDPTKPTAAREPTAPAASAALATSTSDVTAQATIPLPINQSVSTAGVAFGVTQTGMGPDGRFIISNNGNPSPALYAVTGGTGPAGFFQINVPGNPSPGLRVRTGGLGPAGEFIVNNANSTGTAMYATTDGKGSAGRFQSTNSSNPNDALFVWAFGGGSAIHATAVGGGKAGFFEIVNSGSLASGLEARVSGKGPAGRFVSFNPANLNAALDVVNSGTGWAGDFRGTGKGVRITTSRGVGLQVLGGTKQAVVATPAGARSLYTEESSEVWFTDYGFARLTDGRARVLLDPAFAQTVAVDAPYHVFVQAYGDADLYVRERTSLGFEVVSRGGNDRGTQFSYRVVAKRRGFEHTRLEMAPWADHTAE